MTLRWTGLPGHYYWTTGQMERAQFGCESAECRAGDGCCWICVKNVAKNFNALEKELRAPNGNGNGWWHWERAREREPGAGKMGKNGKKDDKWLWSIINFQRWLSEMRVQLRGCKNSWIWWGRVSHPLMKLICCTNPGQAPAQALLLQIPFCESKQSRRGWGKSWSRLLMADTSVILSYHISIPFLLFSFFPSK